MQKAGARKIDDGERFELSCCYNNITQIENDLFVNIYKRKFF